MTRLEQFVAHFNNGRLEDALGEVTDDYAYTDPLVGTLRGRTAHLELMHRILAAFPDRKLTVTGAWADGDTEFCEYVWTGSPATGGERLDAEWAAVLQWRAGSLARQRHYRGTVAYVSPPVMRAIR
jgi:ketosteroid isomerase-like protein